MTTAAGLCWWQDAVFGSTDDLQEPSKHASSAFCVLRRLPLLPKKHHNIVTSFKRLTSTTAIKERYAS